MDMYGQQHAAQDLFRIDDLLDFSNDDLFTSSSAAAAAVMSSSDPPPTNNPASDPHRQSSYGPISSGEFSAEDLYVPKDDVAELEWLSQFVDDSFTEFPANEIAGGGVNSRQDAPSHGRSRSKRNRAASAWVFTQEAGFPTTSAGKSKKKESYPAEASGGDGTPTGGVRRCTHCASEKTPQWRTGPLGPKSLCNACGVRFKSGRLVPEYRPAASPTFELTQHSNSHRKVMELRRQKEILQQEDQTQRQQQLQYHRHHQNFEVC